MQTDYEKGFEDGMKKAMKEERQRCLDMMKRYRDLAKTANDILFFTEMDEAVKNMENWQRGMFGV